MSKSVIDSFKFDIARASTELASLFFNFSNLKRVQFFSTFLKCTQLLSTLELDKDDVPQDHFSKALLKFSSSSDRQKTMHLIKGNNYALKVLCIIFPFRIETDMSIRR